MLSSLLVGQFAAMDWPDGDTVTGSLVISGTLAATGNAMFSADVKLSSTGTLGWTAGAASAAADTTIARSAAGTITTQKIVTTGLVGTTTNDNAAAGCVGEVIESIVASTAVGSFTGGAFKDITSISLTAGDWDVSALLTWNNGGSAIASGQYYANITSVSGGSGSADTGFRSAALLALGAGNQFTMACPSRRISVASTTTYYMTGMAANVDAALTAGGRLTARRAR